LYEYRIALGEGRPGGFAGVRGDEGKGLRCGQWPTGVATKICGQWQIRKKLPSLF
jgi:hypothetical protein